MKILKRVGIAIGVLVVIFFSIGVINPVFEYGNAISINSPKENVWAIYSEKKKEWVEGFDSQKLISGSPFTKDAEYETKIVSGEEMIMHEKITSVEPNTSIVWSLDNDVLTSTYSYAFNGDSTQTGVTTNYQITGKNAFMKSVLYLSKSYLKKQDAKMLTRLKEIAETKHSQHEK
jgi:uncharacterized membrane protein